MTVNRDSQKGFPHGFTLIELLIVIVIMSIVATFALLSINVNQNKRLENITNQMVNVLTLAESEAMLRPATLSLVLKPDSYQFYEYHSNNDPKVSPWVPFNDKVLGNHPIPNDIKIVLKNPNEESDENPQPRVIISGSGDLIPFVILIGKTDSPPRYKIIGEANGTIKSELINAEE